MGVERLVLLLEAMEAVPAAVFEQLDVYLVNLGPAAELAAQELAESLRDQLPGLRLQLHCGGGSFKGQMKKADRSGAKVALLLGEDELARQEVQVKPLRGPGEQQSIAAAELAVCLQQMI
jgi:histidyl-tRNA synthetase